MLRYRDNLRPRTRAAILATVTATYDRIADEYARALRPDPRIGARVEAALGDVRSVINVGAGPGSYEPATTA